MNDTEWYLPSRADELMGEMATHEELRHVRHKKLRAVGYPADFLQEAGSEVGNPGGG